MIGFAEQNVLNQYLANWKSSGNGTVNQIENPIRIKRTAYKDDDNNGVPIHTRFFNGFFGNIGVGGV